jgi:hypothetical protein
LGFNICRLTAIFSLLLLLRLSSHHHRLCGIFINSCKNATELFRAQKRRVHLTSSYRLNLQALMTLMAFSSSSLRLSFIFLSRASLMISLSSVLVLPFWSSLFYFCLGLGFCQPYYHLPWPMPSSRILANAGCYLYQSSQCPGCGVTTTRRNPGFITLEPGEITELVIFSSWHHVIKFAAFTGFVSHTLYLLSSTTGFT